MGKSSPSPPPAPDYAGAAREQGAANKEAAMASSRLNNPNVVNPYGAQTWTEGATPEDRPTLTQTFSPEQQALFAQTNRIKQLLGGLGETGAGALGDVIGKNLDLTGAPGVGGYDATRSRVFDALMARTNEDYANQREGANSDLIAAGIRPGTKAYQDRMQAIERSRTDARNQAELTAGNQAAQAFGLDTQRRKDAIAELLAQRQTPLNEISALMTGSQVSNPFAVPGAAQNANVQAPPLYDAAIQKSNYDTDLYNARRANSSELMSGLFGLGRSLGSAWIMSDRRLKSNIVRIGTHPLGIGIYEFDIFGRRERGVMAQEVATVKPSAVSLMPNGYLAVNYGGL